MKNIHVLPTDKPSRLYSYKNNLFLTTKSHLHSPSMEYQNIYITSDEEIKEGDWYLNTEEKNGNMNPFYGKLYKANKSINKVSSDYIHNLKKIILTTDQELINDGIQAIDYISKEQQKQHLIDMMKDDEESGLYDDIKINRKELICKDCSDSLEDCTCIKGTVDFPKQEDEFCYYSGLPSPTAYSKEEIKLEEVFNDEKKENIKKFIDEINNPSQPNDKLKQAFEKYSEYLEDYENKNTYEHGFKDGAKCQQEISYSEEEVLEIIRQYALEEHLITSSKPDIWFEQFKKK